MVYYHCAIVLQRSYSSDVNPAMQALMSNLAIQQLRMTIPLIRLTDDDVQHYVVFRSAATDSVSSNNSYVSASDAVVDGAEGVTEDDGVFQFTLWNAFNFKLLHMANSVLWILDIVHICGASYVVTNTSSAVVIFVCK